MRLEVDVAEHAGLHTLCAQSVQERDVGRLVVVPRCGARDERYAECGGLLLEQRERQAVAAAHAAVLLQHAHEGGRHAAAQRRALERKIGVLAALHEQKKRRPASSSPFAPSVRS